MGNLDIFGKTCTILGIPENSGKTGNFRDFWQKPENAVAFDFRKNFGKFQEKPEKTRNLTVFSVFSILIRGARFSTVLNKQRIKKCSFLGGKNNRKKK